MSKTYKKYKGDNDRSSKNKGRQISEDNYYDDDYSLKTKKRKKR